MESDRIEAQKVLEHAAWAQRVARAMVRDEHLAEDLAQDALEAGLQRKTPPRVGLRAWLYGTLRNLRRQAARQEGHQRERELRAAAAEPPATPDELLEKVEAQRAVSEAVIQLPEATRSALILRYYEQLPVREVARLLRISEKAAESRIQRGLQQLREIFKSRLGASWVAAMAPLLESSSVAVTATLVMTAKTKLIVAGACALILLGAFAVRAGLRSDPGDELAERTAAGPAHQANAVSLEAPAAPPAGDNAGQDPVRMPAPAGLRLRVLDESGTPVQGARFAIFLAGAHEALASGVTEEDGSAALPESAAGLHAVLAVSGHAPWWGVLPVGPSPEIRLPPGKVVSGLVQVDGKPATRALPLELRSDLRLIPRGAVPAPILALVGIDPQATGTFAGSCDASGRFAFGGLPANWEGAIHCTDLLHMGPGQPDNILWPQPWTQIPAPHRDFILELRESTAVRGRVVLADERTPAFPGYVTTTIYATRKGRQVNAVELKEDGSFEIVMRPFERPQEPVRLEVKVTTMAIAEQIWNFEPVPQDLAVGTLVLPANRSLTLRVTHEDGTPFEGAKAGAVAWQPLQHPSGPDGLLTLEVNAAATSVDVTAEGHYTERLALPAGHDPLEMRAVLRPAQDLRIHLRSPEGVPIAGAAVSILMDRNARNAPSWAPWGESEFAGLIAGKANSWSEPEGQIELVVDTESAGTVTLRYLLPGQMVRVRATPAGSAEMEEATLGPMPEVGDLEHTFVMETGRRTFTGRIIDLEGRGVRPAELRLVAEVGAETVHLASPIVDEEGVFSADLLDEGAFFVVIEASGYASVRRQVLSFDEEAGPMVFRLGAGRSLEFRVLDEAGNPLDGVAQVNPEDRAYLAARLKDGACVITNVPPEDLSVSVSVGGRAYGKRISVSESIVEFILPVHGGIQLVLSEAMQTAAKETPLRLYLAPLEGGKQIVYWFWSHELEFPLVPCGDYWARLALRASFDTEETLGDWKQIVIKPGEVTQLVF